MNFQTSGQINRHLYSKKSSDIAPNEWKGKWIWLDGITNKEKNITKEMRQSSIRMGDKLRAFAAVLETLATHQDIDILKELIVSEIDEKIDTLKKDIIATIKDINKESEERQKNFFKAQFENSEKNNEKRFDAIKAVVDANGESIRNLSNKFTKIYSVVCMVEKKVFEKKVFDE